MGHSCTPSLFGDQVNSVGRASCLPAEKAGFKAARYQTGVAWALTIHFDLTLTVKWDLLSQVNQPPLK